MDDMISRQAAINACIELAEARSKWESDAGRLEISGIDAVVCAIYDLPSAQPGWIPCSTALPKDEEEVIVSIHDDSGDYSCDYTSSGWYAAAGEFWVVDNEASMRVVAWQPLPKPWKNE